DHPNVARTFEVGRVDGEYFLALELVEGESLFTLLEAAATARAPLSAPLLAWIGTQICAGLHHAHTRRDPSGKSLRLVHRDVSPRNVLLSFEGAVKLIDFGVARARGQLSRTQAGNVKGTIAYMSPEQARGQPIDGRADLFSLG